MNQLVSSDHIAALILSVRGQKVILDSDLAAIYGVQTRALNQAVRRNLDRFPPDFMIQLSAEEAQRVARPRSQTVILNPGRGRHRKYLPQAFTEHGALMVSTVLNSSQAVKMSLFIIRAFLKMREGLVANEAILRRLAEIDKSLLTHDSALRDIYQKLRLLLAPPPDPSKPEIGFHVKEDSLLYRIKPKTGVRRRLADS